MYVGVAASRKQFVPIHPPNILSHLPPEAHLGPVDPATLPAEAFEASEEEVRIAEARAALPDPSAALNLHDIEVRLRRGRPCARLVLKTKQEYAQKVLTDTAWAYYRSTGDDEYC